MPKKDTVLEVQWAGLTKKPQEAEFSLYGDFLPARDSSLFHVLSSFPRDSNAPEVRSLEFTSKPVSPPPEWKAALKDLWCAKAEWTGAPYSKLVKAYEEIAEATRTKPRTVLPTSIKISFTKSTLDK